MKEKQKNIKLNNVRDQRLRLMALAEGITQNELINRMIDENWKSWGEGAAAVLFAPMQEPES